MHKLVLAIVLYAEVAAAGPTTFPSFQCGDDVVAARVIDELGSCAEPCRVHRFRLWKVGAERSFRRWSGSSCAQIGGCDASCGNPEGCMSVPTDIVMESTQPVQAGALYLVWIRPHGPSSEQLVCSSQADAVWWLRIPQLVAPRS